jgi:hypothetical protein
VGSGRLGALVGGGWHRGTVAEAAARLMDAVTESVSRRTKMQRDYPPRKNVHTRESKVGLDRGGVELGREGNGWGV